MTELSPTTATPCPHIRSSDEGTSYCALAEQTAKAADARRDLLQRVFSLAKMAVDDALQYDYGDPEDRYIWRELQELRTLVAAELEGTR